VSVRPLMYRLARDYPAADDVILQYDPPPRIPDYMCALLDVPAWTEIMPATMPGEPYLVAEERSYKLEFPAGLKVGICWASGKRDLQPELIETAKQKSLSFREFLPLKRDGVVLVNLQKDHGDRDALRDNGVFDPMVGVTDLMDTAWIVSQLDLVITVDTAVAHLAGALGRPVWNLVRFDAMWPWMRETGKTCWYDSMAIYRQSEPFRWKPVLDRLYADFDKQIPQKAAA
jgi:hypothetical protein